ncbi:MAG: helix-turn-helix domain-containing protein [Bacillus sp. (in: Bacteria)]|nr:helix-turn-helix domain-containing protein [Bacillus sp. (in: firmicutes)]
MLTPVLDDRTLLDSVKVYLECNLNTSLAAKKLYMHRNTLQYRVDKFIEKTSIDIKRFPNAVAVYFMFSVLETSRKED